MIDSSPSGSRSGLGCLFLALILGACRSFQGPLLPPPMVLEEGEHAVGLGSIEEKLTVQAKGEFRNGELLASRLEIEEPDDEVAIKSTITAPVTGGLGEIGGVGFVIEADSRLLDAEGAETTADAIIPGAWAKADCIVRGGHLVLRRLDLRIRKEGEAEEVAGRIDEVDHRAGRLAIGGIRVHFAGQVPVVWDREDEEPPPMDQSIQDPSFARMDGLRRVRRIDDENWRPADQLTIGDFLVIGGEVQYDLDWRDNYNLRDERDRDRLIHELSTTLEFSAAASRNLYAFLKLRLSHEFVHFDEEADIEVGDEFHINEGFLLLEDLPIPGFSLQLGRQDFDQGREWVMDDDLDALRAWVNLDPAVLELSVSTVTFDTDPEEDGITNFLAGLHILPMAGTELFAYGMHRKGGTLVDLSRTHLGISGEGEVGDFEWWADIGVVFGREDDRRVNGWGFDVAVMYVLEDLLFEPSIYGGAAFGVGDGGDGSGTDRSFRQTGLHDNNDKFNGVTSFRYLGELVRPELSNMLVLTAGIGLRPFQNTSIDFLWHYYRQDEAAPLLRDTRLRLDPTGLSRDLGHEWDVVVGIEEFRPLEMEVVFAWFHPGAAFGPDADDAWSLTVQVEWNF